MQLSQLTQDLKPFLAMEVMERGMQLQRQGIQVMQLGVGEPGFEAPPAVVQAAVAALQGGQTHYTASLGMQELRGAIAQECERRRGVAIRPEQVMVTTGTSPAISMVLRLLLDPGDELIVPTPHYPCYPNMAAVCNARSVFVPSDPAQGYRVDVDRVRAAIGPRTRGILLASPANPTGAVQPREVVRELCELGVPVLSDEIYDGLLYGGARVTSPLSFTDECFVFDGFSKRYAMTGFRLGYVIAPEQAVRPLRSMQQNLHISASQFVQRAGIAALEAGESHVAQMRERYAERRELLVSGLRELGFGIAVPPAGAFYVLADARHLGTDSLALAYRLLDSAHVAVAPGRDFGEAAEGFLRFSFAATEGDIRTALQRLRVFLEQGG